MTPRAKSSKRAVIAVSVVVLACLVPIRHADAATGAGRAAVERLGGAVRLIAAKRCLRIRQSGGTSTLVNFCGTCVSAKLEHQRPTGNFPIHRDVTVPDRGSVQLPLSFRSGRTRVLEERRCGGGPVVEANGEQCVDLLQTRDGGRLLINNCRACRAVVVERVSSHGNRSLGTYTIDAKTYLPYGAAGSDRARVLVENPCR